MKHIHLAVAAVLALFAPAASATDYPVIPAPVSFTPSAGEFVLPSYISYSAGKGVAKNKIGDYLKMRGFDVRPSKKNADFAFALCDTLPPEGYVMNITPDGVGVAASTDAGFFYAVQTLSQLAGKSRLLPSCRIVDYPRYPYRSLMLDPSRYFIPKEEVLKMIDAASTLKLNKLHLHLSDDNGWRIEIKKYPKLTEVGAWRVDREEYFPGRLNATEGEPTPIGGFYTQDDMREIVAYAAARNITVIPEIDVPAHSAAAIASYPELACPVTDKFVGVFPGIGGPDASIILCAGNEKVYEFYKDVIDELLDIFPSEYFHLGGDEAEKSHWEKCPLCNKKKDEEHLADFEELQGYFMDQLSSYVRSKGRTPIAWDEVTLGSPKEEMVIMGWNGYGQAATNYAKKTGSQFILTPAKVMYLIRYQGPQWFEPFTYFGNATLKDIYTFEPVKPDWPAELRKQLLGFQGSLWTEFITSPEHLEHQVFPRLIAVADMAWRQENAQDWPAFLTALDELTPQLDARGINYARSMFNLDHKARPAGVGSVSVDLSCIRPDMQIRYSQADPSLVTFVEYDQPFVVNTPGKVYAATFRDGRQQGQTLILPIEFSAATGAKVESPNCNNELAAVLTNGLRGSDRNSDFEWAGWHDRDAEFTIDLGEVKELNSAKLGNLANTHICVAAPRRVKLYGSADGSDFTLLGEAELPDEIVWHKGAAITDIDFGPLQGTPARFVKVVAENPGRIPEGYARATAKSWLYFDELTIN